MNILTKNKVVVNDEVFKYYFYFIQERMNIFWNRFENKEILTNDEIFKNNKFTNVYRSCDRVSQYLIKNVIYNKKLSDIDILLRIIIFKIFNKIETFEYIENYIGDYLKVSNFDVDKISLMLTNRIKETPIFSGAYMMTGTHSKYNSYNSKHEKWLRMVKSELLEGKKFEKIIQAKTFDEVYDILRETSFLGNFLSYQYAIDMNYSEVINFDENSFVMAGIGAIRGIKKCFYEFPDYEYAIKYTFENFENYQKKYNYNDFKNLFGRQPTLIDLQNCFCETDKYLRAKMPELKVGNTRIKQRFNKKPNNLECFFPPKWGL